MNLKSLTIFFPFYNDEGTVGRQIRLAYDVGKKFTKDLEVIAIHGGSSKDKTLQKIKDLEKEFPKLVLIDKSDNAEGYAVIKHGFKKAGKEWVFYTDGDAQYHLEEDLEKLIKKQIKTNADVVNGYKKNREDGFIRTLLGGCYKIFSKKLFNLPIRDIDCDFRLIRKSFLDKFELESTDSSILPELIKKLEISKAKFSEVEVSHYRRTYGKSSYATTALLKEKLIGDIRLYLKMR